jgi:stalled ribosome rescue protein Dom34
LDQDVQSVRASSTHSPGDPVKHAVVWIDHQEARVIEVDAAAVEQSIVDTRGPHIHRHPKDQEVRVRNHPDDEHRYFHEVARALEGDGEVLLTGPSKTKFHFMKYVHAHERSLEARIVGIETSDHPTNPQLVAHLREYFHESAPRLGLKP